MLKISNLMLGKLRPNLKDVFPEVKALGLDGRRIESFPVSYVVPSDRTYGDSKARIFSSTWIVIGEEHGIMSKEQLDRTCIPECQTQILLELTISRMSHKLGYVIKLANTSLFGYTRSIGSLGGKSPAVALPQCRFEYSMKSGQYCRRQVKGGEEGSVDNNIITDSEEEAGEDKGEDSENSDSQSSYKSKESGRPLHSAADSNADFSLYLQAAKPKHSARSRAGSMFQPYTGGSQNGKDQVTPEQLWHDLTHRIRKYSAGVKTYRLINGERCRVKKPRGTATGQSTLDPELETQDMAAQQKTSMERDMNRVRLSALRKQFTQNVNSQPMPAAIANLLMVTTVMLMAFFTLTIVAYSVAESSLYKLRDSLSISWRRSQIYFYGFDMQYLATSLALLQNGTITNYENATNSSEYETMLRGQISYELELMLDETQKVTKMVEAFPAIYNAYVIQRDVVIKQYSTPSIAIEKNYTYIDSMYMTMGSIITLNSQPLSMITLDNLDLLFVRDNILNGISTKSANVDDVFTSSLTSFIADRSQIFRYVLTASIVFFIVSGILMYPFLMRAHWAQEEVLAFFLRIPRDAITKLHDQCEHYGSNEQKHENSSLVLEIGVERGEEETDALVEEDEGRGNDPAALQKREFLRAASNWCSTLGKVAGLVLLADCYFFFCSNFMDYLGEVYTMHMIILYSLSQVNCLPIIALNTLREVVLNTDMKIMDISDKTAMASAYIMYCKQQIEGTLTVRLHKVDLL